MSTSVTSLSLLDIPQTPLSEVLAEVSAKSDFAKLLDVLNSPAPFDKHQSREEISQEQLMDVYETHRENNTEAQNTTENKETDLTKLIQVASETLPEVNDVELKNAFKLVLSRATTLTAMSD